MTIRGIIEASSARVDALRGAPFIGLPFCDDEGNVEDRPLSLQAIGLVSEDHRDGLYRFELDVHEDDLANADFSVVEEFFLRVCGPEVRAGIVAMDNRRCELSWMALWLQGTSTIDLVWGDDPQAEGWTVAKASAFIEASGWEPLIELHRSIASG